MSRFKLWSYTQTAKHSDLFNFIFPSSFSHLLFAHSFVAFLFFATAMKTVIMPARRRVHSLLTQQRDVLSQLKWVRCVLSRTCGAPNKDGTNRNLHVRIPVHHTTDTPVRAEIERLLSEIEAYPRINLDVYRYVFQKPHIKKILPVECGFLFNSNCTWFAGQGCSLERPAKKSAGEQALKHFNDLTDKLRRHGEQTYKRNYALRCGLRKNAGNSGFFVQSLAQPTVPDPSSSDAMMFGDPC